jgi:hypothetical protein
MAPAKHWGLLLIGGTMTKRAKLWSALLLGLLIGVMLVGFVWLAVKGGRETLSYCEIRPKFCARQ